MSASSDDDALGPMPLTKKADDDGKEASRRPTLRRDKQVSFVRSNALGRRSGERSDYRHRRPASAATPFPRVPFRKRVLLNAARDEAVRCILPCWDEDDDGIPPFCRHELCPLDVSF